MLLRDLANLGVADEVDSGVVDSDRGRICEARRENHHSPVLPLKKLGTAQ
jgi:hypothetical protein